MCLFKHVRFPKIEAAVVSSKLLLSAETSRLFRSFKAGFREFRSFIKHYHMVVNCVLVGKSVRNTPFGQQKKQLLLNTSVKYVVNVIHIKGRLAYFGYGFI